MRRRQHPLRRLGDLVGAAQPLDAAEHIAGIVPAFRGHLLEQRLGLGGFVDDRGACLGDGQLDRAEVARRPQAGVVVLDVEARVHARLVVGGRDQAGEHLRAPAPRRRRKSRPCARLRAPPPGRRRDRLRQAVRAPARSRPFAVRGGIASEKLDDRASVGLLLPQRRFGAPAQRRNPRPAWIGGDESRVAREIEIGLVAAQDHPFDQLAGERIGDRALDAGRLVGPALVRQLDGLFDGGEIERRGVRGRRHRQRRGGSYRRRSCNGRSKRDRRRWFVRSEAPRGSAARVAKDA